MNIRFLQKHLKQNNVYLKKSLSQNFLIDENIQKKIVHSASPTGHIVLEIGPGAGMLTDALVPISKFVIAIEKDSHFAGFLKQKFSSGVEIIEQDFLKISLEEELEKLSLKESKIKVIANIPYQITTPILAKLFTNLQQLDSITLMVQEEVAQRMISKPNTKSYGRLSIFCQFYTYPKYLFSVSRNCFYPRPKVQSAVIELKPRQELLLEKKLEELFFSIVKRAFLYRRKTLVHIFKKIYPSTDIINVLASIGKDSRARGEQLSINDFIQITKFLSKITPTEDTDYSKNNAR